MNQPTARSTATPARTPGRWTLRSATGRTAAIGGARTPARAIRQAAARHRYQPMPANSPWDPTPWTADGEDSTYRLPGWIRPKPGTYPEPPPTEAVTLIYRCDQRTLFTA